MTDHLSVCKKNCFHYHSKHHSCLDEKSYLKLHVISSTHMACSPLTQSGSWKWLFVWSDKMNSFKYIQATLMLKENKKKMEEEENDEERNLFLNQMKMKRSNLYRINFLEKHFHPIVSNPLQWRLFVSCMFTDGLGMK